MNVDMTFFDLRMLEIAVQEFGETFCDKPDPMPISIEQFEGMLAAIQKLFEAFAESLEVNQ